MATNPMEILYYLQDIFEHLRVSRRRAALRRPGQGFDYTRDNETVERLTARLHPRRMRLQVSQVIQATPTTKTFRFERVDGPLPPFRAGQYINVFLEVDGVPTSRPYSIASAPGQNYLELSVKHNPGGFVAPFMLNDLEVGDEVETSGPAGNFYYESLIDGDELVFLAGGSGITPFMSMIRDLLGRGQPLRIHLLYGSRTPDDVIYGVELAELAARHPNFEYTAVISEPPPGYDGLAGFLDADLLRQRVGGVEGKTFYVCGPPVMYDFCMAALEELGAPRHKIRRERYGPPADVTREPGWPPDLSAEAIFEVEIVGYRSMRGDRSIRAPAGEPLMNTLERYGVALPAVCRVGDCSACRVKLLSGRVFMPEDAGVRQADRQHGYIHACISYPLEDLRIRLPG